MGTGDFNNDGTSITYAYDPFGRRIEKNANGNITQYVYDNEDIIMEYDGSNSLTAKYTHGLGIDEPLAVQQDATNYYYHADGLGSIVAITSASGALAQTYSYDSFGNITISGSIVQPYTYTAREFDSETGMHYYRARYYDPKAGRFITRDPIGFSGGINQYAYVKNNPVNYIDPKGLAYNWGGDGRLPQHGPKYSNWCGLYWSGGWNPQKHGGVNGSKPPMDSGDECYKDHDLCYDKCKCSDDEKKCKKTCNRELIGCLRNLDKDSRKWLRPPRPGTEVDSETFKDHAIDWFMEKI